jgi:putative transposase
VTYIPMRRGFLYLVAIMDWFSRKVLTWRLSNTMVADFCVTGLEEAIARFGKPEIFNTDQGLQFTSFCLHQHFEGCRHRHLDGRSWPLDGQRLHRAKRSLKYQCVFLNAFETGSEAKTAIGCWIAYYNADRPHSVFGSRTPDEVYTTQASEEKLAA